MTIQLIALVLLSFTVTTLSTNQEDVKQTFINPPESFEWQFESLATMSGVARAVIKKILSVEQAEGVGARVRRSVGRPEVWRRGESPMSAPPT